MAQRLRGRCGYPDVNPFRPGVIHESQMQKPATWRKPRMIFVCSMGDIFHDAIPFEQIDRVFGIMEANNRHTFQILTKRSERMLGYFYHRFTYSLLPHNVWWGVTLENSNPLVTQRLTHLSQIPAKVRFVSVEPMIGSVSLGHDLLWLNWVICGAETGQKARPCELRWVRTLRDECNDYRVPFFFKKFADGSRQIDGQMWQQTPANNGMEKTKKDAGEN
jgi:protein gp37